MAKLTELEKEKVIACVCYQVKNFECERYKLELAYDKLGHYDEEYDKALEHAKEMNEFYSNLMRKLKEDLQNDLSSIFQQEHKPIQDAF